ncbi:MAG: hypothetical protein U9Q83_04265 [Bacteroidota bacterium]|nr:hypothetical protein [Bacteroidota bacterium]
MEIRILIRHIIYFVILYLLQILVFNYITLGPGLFPSVYLLIIILLPIEIEKIWLLVTAFFVGFILDFSNDTLALNTSALLFATFLRPFILQSISIREGYEIGKLPSFKNYGVNWFILYTLIFVFIFEFVYLSLDIFSFSKIGVILLKSVVNTLFSASFVVLLHLLFFRNS